jgi:hypothetical protein
MFKNGGVSSISDATTIEKWLFFGNVHDLEEFHSLQRVYFDQINGSASMRLVVFETWLLIDYCIRGLLMAGLQIRDHEELDLRYNLLPRGFRECVSLLRKLYAVNKALPEEPRHISGPARIWLFIREFDPDLLERLQIAEDAYRKASKLPMDDKSVARVLVQSVQYRTVPDAWLDVAVRVDESWDKRAGKLNAARNLAAHCHDEKRIAHKLGFNGPDALERVRVECLSLAEQLVGVSNGTHLRTATAERN